MKRERYYLAGILAFSLALRCIALSSRGIQYDDAFSILLSQRPIAEIVTGTAADTMPPLYYFLLHYWMLIANSIGWIRILSIGLNLSSILAIYALIRDLFGSEAGLWSALMAGISPLQIYHAQDIRMYALLALGQIGYIYFFSQIWRGKVSAWLWAGLIGCGTIAMYSHNLAIFGLVVPDIFLVLRKEWRLLGKVILAQLVIGLLALPWLLLVPGQIAKIQKAFWTPQPGAVEILQSIILFAATIPLPGTWLIVAAILSVEILVILTLELIRLKRQNPRLGLLLLVAVLPPGLLFIASYVMRPVFVPRGFLVSALAYDGLAGIVIAASWKRKVGGLVAASFILAAIVSLPYQIGYNGFPRSPFQEAVQYLSVTARPGDAIIHDNKLSFFPAHYFAPDLQQKFIGDPTGTPNDTLAPASQQALHLFPQPDMAAASETASRIYYVVFSEAIQEYQAGDGQPYPVLKWLNQHYKQVDHKAFNDLEIYAYEH